MRGILDALLDTVQVQTQAVTLQRIGNCGLLQEDGSLTGEQQAAADIGADSTGAKYEGAKWIVFHGGNLPNDGGH